MIYNKNKIHWNNPFAMKIFELVGTGRYVEIY